MEYGFSETSLDMNSTNFGGNPVSPLMQEGNVVQQLKNLCGSGNVEGIKMLLLSLPELPAEAVHGSDNILCYLVKHYEKFGDNFMNELLKKNPSYFRNVINGPNAEGQTPAIIACMQKRFKFIESLVAKGADIKKPTNAGLVLETVRPSETSAMMSTLSSLPSIKQSDIAQSVQQFINKGRQEISDSTLGLGKDLKRTAKSIESMPSSIHISDMTSALDRVKADAKKMDVGDIFGNMFDNIKSKVADLVSTKSPSSQRMPSQVSASPMSLASPSPAKTSNNGVVTSEMSTESFMRGVLDGSLASKHGISGGSRSVVVGQRMMNQIPSYSSGGSSESSARPKSKKSHKSNFELSRVTNDIHEKVVQEIMNVLGVSEDDAKIYKSILYYRVKNEHPEYNGYERAVEMQKLATKDVLETLDIEGEKKRRSESPRPESPRPERKEKKDKKEKPVKEKKAKKSKKEVSRTPAFDSSSSSSNTSDIEF